MNALPLFLLLLFALSPKQSQSYSHTHMHIHTRVHRHRAHTHTHIGNLQETQISECFKGDSFIFFKEQPLTKISVIIFDVAISDTLMQSGSSHGTQSSLGSGLSGLGSQWAHHYRRSNLPS